MVGRGGGDRKQFRVEFQGLRRNAEERQVIEKEQWGIQRNPYWPLNGPSFFLPLRFLRGGFSPTTLDTKLASGPNLAARMAAKARK